MPTIVTEAPPQHDLTTMEGRLNEVRRTKDIIGWTWKTVGDRLGLTFTQSQALQTGKRAVADSDLEWMQELAKLVASLPRPPVVGMPEPTMTAIPADVLSAAETAAESRGRTMMRGEVIRSIADRYVALETEGLNADQLEGAKHAMAQLAMTLGVLPAVRELIEARRPMQPAPVPTAAVEWEPPTMQRDLGERGRVPF